MEEDEQIGTAPADAAKAGLGLLSYGRRTDATLTYVTTIRNDRVDYRGLNSASVRWVATMIAVRWFSSTFAA